MSTQHRESDNQATAIRRTGPVGRVVRVLGTALMAWFVFQWLEAGMTWFSSPSTPANLWVWAVTGLAVYYGLYQLPESGFGRPWGVRVVATSGGILAAVAVVTLAVQGEPWAAPLTGVLYGLNVGFLIAVTVSYLVAVFLGTPGCEVGGLGELIRRLRHEPNLDNQDAMWCIAGLNSLDRWEAGRRQRARR